MPTDLAPPPGSTPSPPGSAPWPTSWWARRARCSSWPASTPLDRIQFDRPIAQFQAVRHRLAESLVAIEAADAAARPRRGTTARRSPPSVAKAIAGRSARTVARHCQQVLAGIGFTTEHPFHRSSAGCTCSTALLGDARTLTRRLGEDLLARRTVPAILPL